IDYPSSIRHGSPFILRPPQSTVRSFVIAAYYHRLKSVVDRSSRECWKLPGDHQLPHFASDQSFSVSLLAFLVNRFGSPDITRLFRSFCVFVGNRSIFRQFSCPLSVDFHQDEAESVEGMLEEADAWCSLYGLS